MAIRHLAFGRRAPDDLPEGVHTKRVPITSYEDYRRVQDAGNARKISSVFAKEANIAVLARYVEQRVGPAPRILCHGTRNGAELRYFKQALPAATVLGTDIASSAELFPDTIQWDFHDLNDAWVGAWHAIYSNSWDHAYDPERAFANWLKCLTPHGVLLLEHSVLHNPDHAEDLDPFGATLPALIEILNTVGRPNWRVIDVLDMPDCKRRQRTVVVSSA